MEHLSPIPKPYAGFMWPGSTVLANTESAFAKKALSDPKGFLYNLSGMLSAEMVPFSMRKAVTKGISEGV